MNREGLSTMQGRAISKYVRISPTKLRPYVDVVRGYTVERALAWLKTCGTQRVIPIEKIISSAFANVKQFQADASMDSFFVKIIKVDAGPTRKYFKPGAMGRAQPQRKRTSHIEVILEKDAFIDIERGA
jgi:large subunit ribosomal protein L22